MAKLDDRVNVDMEPDDALRVLLDAELGEPEEQDDEDDAKPTEASSD